MPASDVRVPSPLTRFETLYPAQFGVPFTGSDKGRRLSCEGTIFYVDPNHTDANDSRDGTEPTAPLATVATAITKCEAYKGDVILVMANNAYDYNDADEGRTTAVAEAVVVDVPGISIIGVAPSPLGVYWEIPAASTGIEVRVTDVVIEGFAFMGVDNNETAIVADYDNYYGDCLTVRHCFFDEDVQVGVNLMYSWYAEIHSCLFESCTYGIYNLAGDGDAAYARIHHNHFHDCGTGAIWLPEGDRCFIWENQLYNNDAEGGVAAANVFINTGSGSRNLVSRNVLGCLLPVPANGDYDDTCSASGTDCWVHNYCLDGPTVTNPT